MKARRKRQGGFTLIELMVSLVLFSFAIAGVLAIAVSMAQGYREQRQIVQTEGTARGALDFIADAIRMTSPGVTNADVKASTASPTAGEPNVIVGDIEDTETDDTTTSKCELGAIRVYNNFNAGTDALEIVYASGGAVTSVGSGGFTPGTATLPLTDITNIAVGDHLLITNGTKGHIVRVTALTAGTPNTATVSTGACVLNTAAPYAQGELVVRVLRARFYIGTFDGITNLVLLMDPDGEATAYTPEPLADYVEDFQVAVGIDENDNKSIDATEWSYSMGGPTSVALTDLDLKALRITLVARAISALPGTTANYRRPEVEDHAQATTLDTFRRRILTATVDVRNLGGSP